MGEAGKRLVCLLYVVQAGAPRYDEEGDDAMLDAWFGRRSPVFARWTGPAVDRFSTSRRV